MTWIAKDPEAFAGQTVGSGHCVDFARQASGAPHTSQWRPGAGVNTPTAELRPGMLIATFDPDGTYGNHTDGRSHAAVYMGRQENGGLLVWDCWRGQPVHQRTIRAKAGAGLACDDADRFAIVRHDSGPDQAA
jgi:hypothetical protein